MTFNSATVKQYLSHNNMAKQSSKSVAVSPRFFCMQQIILAHEILKKSLIPPSNLPPFKDFCNSAL